jgi:glycosyltransferase involved in cell wall biosynthesis
VNLSRAQEAEGLALRLFEAARSRVIPNGVDVAGLGAAALHRDAARADLGVPPAGLVVGSVARFDPVKRLDLLIEAAAREPAITLVLVGEGDEGPRLQALARRVSARVVFAGERQPAARLLRAFDVYATASRKEGMPLAVLEAMAVGLPVLASDIPAHREVLGASAGLVAGDVDAFAKAFGTLARDAATRNALGAENHDRARHAFDAETMVSAHAALYGEVVNV